MHVRKLLFQMTSTEKIGYLGVFTFLFFAWFGNAVGTIGLSLSIIAFVTMKGNGQSVLFQDPLVILFFVFFLYVIGRTVWAIIEFPHLLEMNIHQARVWLSPFMFIPMAWWLSRYSHGVYFALLIVLVGILLSILRLTDWPSCHVFVGNIRCGFGFQIVFSALILGASIYGLLIFAPRLIGKYSLSWLWFLRMSLWLILVTMNAYFLILTQTRTMWGILAVLLPGGLCARYWHEIKDIVRGKNSTGFFLGLIVLLLLAILAWNNRPVLSLRIERTMKDCQALKTFNLNPENIQNNALGLRFAMMRQGYNKWLERPFWGWGTAGINYPCFFSNINKKTGYMTHLHNTYLEILARFGLVGGIILLLMVVYLFYGLHVSYKDRVIERDFYCFALGILMMLAIWSFFDYQMSLLDFRTYICVLFSLLYSPVIRWRYISKQEDW